MDWQVVEVEPGLLCEVPPSQSNLGGRTIPNRVKCQHQWSADQITPIFLFTYLPSANLAIDWCPTPNLFQGCLLYLFLIIFHGRSTIQIVH